MTDLDRLKKTFDEIGVKYEIKVIGEKYFDCVIIIESTGLEFRFLKGKFVDIEEWI